MGRPIELVVLDFDGTFTRVDEEAVPFLVAYREGLRALLGGELDQAWDRARSAIEADPDRYGWQYDGRIVAPSHADPYVLATSIAQVLLHERGMGNQGARPAVLEGLFRDAYTKAATVFRSDASSVIESMLGEGVPIYVVTNSRTEDVARKIAALGAKGSERLKIHGDARKFVIAEPKDRDPRFDAIPAEMRIEGLGRPIYVRRGMYFEVLRAIWEETGIGADETLVCGDIYELDLALPALLGARIHMVGRPNTPRYERDAVVRAGGSFSVDLSGALEAFARVT
jgi:hypothetical protein